MMATLFKFESEKSRSDEKDIVVLFVFLYYVSNNTLDTQLTQHFQMCTQNKMTKTTHQIITWKTPNRSRATFNFVDFVVYRRARKPIKGIAPYIIEKHATSRKQVFPKKHKHVVRQINNTTITIDDVIYLKSRRQRNIKTRDPSYFKNRRAKQRRDLNRLLVIEQKYNALLKSD